MVCNQNVDFSVIQETKLEVMVRIVNGRFDLLKKVAVEFYPF